MDLHYKIRTAVLNDVEEMEKLFITSTAKHFGMKREPPLANIFYEYQSHRFLVYEDSDPSLFLAYCEFCVYPNIAALGNDSWIQWLKVRYCINLRLTTMNTMFMNFFICIKPDEMILKQAAMEIFFCEHKLSYLLIVRPPNYSVADYIDIEKYGVVYYPKNFDLNKRKNLATIILIERKDFMPAISFRKALPEDNDDVIEMIDHDQPEMRQQLGDYFIAELLLGTGGSSVGQDKIIVSEESSSTTGGSTGMMWLAEENNIEALIKTFDFENLGNLVSFTPDGHHGHVELKVFTQHLAVQNFDRQNSFSRRRSIVMHPFWKNSLTQKEKLYRKFQSISDNLMKRETYINGVSKVLEITFDVDKHLPKAKRNHINYASKAFVVKNFILHPSLRLEYTYYYLCAMFSAYPDHDYCLVPIPSGSKVSHSLWSLLTFFTRMPHRPSCHIGKEIFMVHRSSISTELSIYPYEASDLDDVIQMCHRHDSPGPQVSKTPSQFSTKSNQNNENSSKVIDLVKSICKDVLHNIETEFTVSIIRCGNQRDNSTTIGFIIMRPFTDYGTIYKKYVLPFADDMVTYDRGEILVLRLHPFFHIWTDEILRTVAVRTTYRELYYFQPLTGLLMPNDLTNKLTPIEPRRQARNWFLTKDYYRRDSHYVDLPKINLIRDRFYLFRHNLFPSKFFGNKSSLVIVGFSDICKAFLRLMVFGWNTPDKTHVMTSNCLPSLDVTVIVRNGEVEAEYNPNIHCNFCDNQDNCYLNTRNSCPFVMDATIRMNLRNWIHFVSGRIHKLNRAEKSITLDNNCTFYYDKLLLLCDRKYGVPNKLQIEEELLSGDSEERNWESPGDDDEQEEPKAGSIFDSCQLPYNDVQINTRLDKIIFYHKLMEYNRCRLPNKKIVVYGNNLAAYECIHFLLEHGCEANNIVSVRDKKSLRPEYTNDPTNDDKLTSILEDMIIDLGIESYESVVFDKFTIHESACFIKTAHFIILPSNKPLAIDCTLFIDFQENFLSHTLEEVFIQSGLHLSHGKIFVTEDYLTSDPHIYAAGMHVRFNKQVFYQYTYVSELEVAEKLIDILQLSNDPYSKENKFHRPRLFHAVLPLNFNILKITQPKRFMVSHLSNEYSLSMTTYQNREFCRIRMSQKLIVEEIVCVTRKHRPLYFMEFFCGKHDFLLNNLRYRWNMGLIKNFISFFQEPWTEYIMHDRFEEMQAHNHTALIALLHQTHSGIIGLNLNVPDFEDASQVFLQANLLRFLRKYRKEFVNKFVLPEDWENPNDI